MVGRTVDSLYRIEHLIEALEECRGFVNAAQKHIFKKWGYKLGVGAIKSIVRDDGMQEWLDDIRKALVEDCMAKTFHKAIKEGDNACMFWVLGKYKHHVDFLEPIEEDAPERVPGEIADFMTLLKDYDAHSTTQQQAAPSISAEQRKT